MSMPSLRVLRHQRGSTLLVAMIMIFMLSIMGVSSMRSSSLEKRMTINAIESSTTLQAAESVSDIVATNRRNLEIASATPDVEHVIDVPGIRGDIGLAVEASIEQTGDGLAAGNSIGSGAFKGYRYRIEGVAAIPNVDARARIEQGIVQVAPGL